MRFARKYHPGASGLAKPILTKKNKLKNRLFCSVLRNINPGLDVRAKEGYREGEEENQECFSLSSVFGQTCHMLFFPAPSDLPQLLDYFRI